MNDRKPSQAEIIAKSVEKVSDSKGLAAIGAGLGWGIATFGIAAIFAAMPFSGAAQKWDGHLHPQTKCYDLKEISGKLLKINTCTGETVEVDPETGKDIVK